MIRHTIFTIKKMLLVVFILLSIIAGSTAVHSAETTTLATVTDPHYTDGGFFDIHVCNWPDRPLFFLTLWSTTQYKTLKKVEIKGPNGQILGELNLAKYRLLKRKNKPDKHVFIKTFEIPQWAGDGAYTARATFKDGKEYIAKDFVIIEAMQRATNTYPALYAENFPVNAELKWDPIPGAQHYQVFVMDGWEGKTIFTSKLLPEPKIRLPKGLLKPDEPYEWQIHARDINEHALLGDFNHGSLTNKMAFSTAP